LVRKTGQIVGRGRHRWLVRVFLGRDRKTRKRRYHNRTIHGPARRAQEYLTKLLRERDMGRHAWFFNTLQHRCHCSLSDCAAGFRSGFQKLGMGFSQPGKATLSEFNRQLYDCFQFLV